MTFKEAFGNFLADQLYKGNSPETHHYYDSYVQHYLRDTGVVMLEEFTEKSIRDWLIGHKHLSPNTMRGYDRALRVVARWFHARGYLPASPMAQLPKPKGKIKEFIVFTPSDIKAMLDDTQDRREGCRDRALLLLLLDTGIRIGEANNLTLQDIIWTEDLIKVDGKTGFRQVPFGSRAKRALKTYIDAERKARNPRVLHVFLTQEGDPINIKALIARVRKIAIAANVKATKRGAHTFRHTFAVEYLRAGGDVFTLQQILGHTTLDMTRKYVHLTQGDLREAHRKYSPVSRML